MAETRIRISVPAKAVKGEIMPIKALIAHPMENGMRKDAAGAVIPRKIINRFVCTYNDEIVFSADWHPAVSGNPYLAFTTIATESGQIAMSWIDDDGSIYSARATVVVE